MRGYRVGIVGPRSPFGQRVRTLLNDGGLAVTELKLFDSASEGTASLTQFGDEVVVTQPLDPDLFPHLDVLFVAGGDSDLLNRMANEAAAAGVLTLVEGAVGLGAPVVTADRLQAVQSSAARLGTVPRAASHLLGRALATVAESSTIERAVASILVPAQVLGDAGAEELYEQTVSILNFRSPPTAVFQEQMVFNVKPAGSTPEAGLLLADSVGWEASRLAGLDGVLAVSLIQVPVFHGTSASIWVETKEPLDPKALRASFRSKSFDTPKSARGAKVPSPVSISGSDKLHIGPVLRVPAARPAGLWIWAVADSAAYDSASEAVAIARTVLS
jgi:aspartate-semialdehyde dehydrogenase